MGILRSMLRQMMQSNVVQVLDSGDVPFVDTPKSMVVSFTVGAMTSEPYARLLLAARGVWSGVPLLTVRSQDFTFPTKDSFENLICPQMAKLTGHNLQMIRTTFAPLVAILAMPFQPGGSISVLSAETGAVVGRINAMSGENGGPGVWRPLTEQVDEGVRIRDGGPSVSVLI